MPQVKPPYLLLHVLFGKRGVEALPSRQHVPSPGCGGPRMMPDERLLQDVMASTLHTTLDGFTGPLHVLMLPEGHSSVPKHSCL